MSSLSYLTNRSYQLEPVDLYPCNDMTLVESEGSTQSNLHRHCPHLFSERLLEIGHCDKVFTSTWLNEDLFLVGTKSSQLLLINSTNGQVIPLPLLSNHKTPDHMDNTGIHSIQRSPNDGCYLASGGLHPNEIAIYKLPEMTPYVLGQVNDRTESWEDQSSVLRDSSHCDWIFDIAWISDNVLVTGSRDSTMAVWRVPDITTLLVEERLSLSSLMTPWASNHPLAETVPSIQCLFKFANENVMTGGKVRSLSCNRQSRVLASLQTSMCESTVHFWDIETFKELSSVSLFHRYENVCMELQQDYNLYAIGSRSHVSLVDWRVANHTVGSIRSRDRDNGVRSLQFKDELLSIGSGAGMITFYDLRASSYWSCNNDPSSSNGGGMGSDEICSLKTTRGWLKRDTNFQEFFSNLPTPPNALYTHQYSPSYCKMLVAGGPLPLGLYGNYCSVWS